VGDNLLHFGFTFFYVDRLAADKSNEVEVQSEGMNVLMNVVVELAELGIMGDEWTARTFTQRFADLCAGAYLNVTLEVTADWTCPVDYDVEDEVDIVKDENSNE
jgi:hypothetical protein